LQVLLQIPKGKNQIAQDLVRMARKWDHHEQLIFLEKFYSDTMVVEGRRVFILCFKMWLWNQKLYNMYSIYDHLLVSVEEMNNP